MLIINVYEVLKGKTIHQLIHPLLRKLQVLVLFICKSSMNIYIIMYRVLYNEIGGNFCRIEMMM